MQDNNFNNMMFLVMLFVWLFYPFLVMLLRPKIFNLKNIKYSSYRPNWFYWYSMAIGICTTVVGLVSLGLITGDNYNFGGIIICILLGIISETVVLFPDKLEKMFNVNLKSYEDNNFMTKFVIIYIISFVIILRLIKHFILGYWLSTVFI